MIYTLFNAVLSGNIPNMIAAIVGGVVGGLFAILWIVLLGFAIAAVTLSLRKRGAYHTCS